MTDTITKYRKIRKENPTLPARYALSWAKQGDPREGWDYVSNSDNQYTKEVDGFTITLKVEIESQFPVDKDLGEYVEGRNSDYDYEWNGNYPRPAQELPLNLPYTSFASGSYSRDSNAYPYFVPEGVEEQFDFFRRFGQSKQVAWLMTKEWVEERIKEWFGGPLYYADIIVTASLNGVDLGGASIHTSYVDGDDYEFACVEEHGLIEDAVSAAKDFIKNLKEVPV